MLPVLYLAAYRATIKYLTYWYSLIEIQAPAPALVASNTTDPSPELGDNPAIPVSTLSPAPNATKPEKPAAENTTTPSEPEVSATPSEPIIEGSTDASGLDNPIIPVKPANATGESA